MSDILSREVALKLIWQDYQSASDSDYDKLDRSDAALRTDRDKWRDDHALMEMRWRRAVARQTEAEKQLDSVTRERNDARSETAACIRFLEVELGWEDFRSEGFVGQDAVSQSTQNCQKLSAFLKEKGNHGAGILAENTRLRENLEAADKRLDWLDQNPLALTVRGNGATWAFTMRPGAVLMAHIRELIDAAIASQEKQR